MERKYDIDNLRWLAILLLFPFHAAQIWSGGEYSGFYIWSHTNTALYVFSTAVYPWYMTILFVISLTALLIVRLQKKYLPKFRVGSLSYFFIILLFVPEWFCLYILNIGGKSLGQFMILFLFGYYILSEESILQKLQQYRFVSLALCILSGSLYTYLYCFENTRSIWITGLYIFFGWTVIIMLLGMGQSKLNFHNRLSVYLTQASFPVYILHMPILVVVGFFSLKLPIGVAGQFLLIVLISAIATFLIYEIVKRIPVLRFFLGIKKQHGVEMRLK